MMGRITSRLLFNLKFLKLFTKLGVLSGANAIILFFYPFYVLKTFGLSIFSDAFFAALSLPQFFLTIFSTSLTHVLVATFTSIKKDNFYAEVWTFFLKTALFFLVLCSLLHLFASEIVIFLFQGFDDETQTITTEVLHVLINNIFFIAVLSIFSSAMYSKEKFIKIELIIMCSNLLGLVLLVFFIDFFGIVGAAWSYLIRAAIAPMIIMASFGKFQLTTKNEVFNQIMGRVKYLLIGNIYFKSEIIYDRVLASQIFTGSLSAFNFAQQIYAAGHMIMNKAVANPFVPKIANLYNSRRFKDLQLLVIKALSFQFIIGFSVLIVIYFFGKEIIGFVLQMKSMEGGGEIITTTMLFLGGLWIAGLLGQIISSTYYAMGNTKTPVIVSSISFTFSLLLRFFMTNLWGIKGLALAISLFYLFNSLILGLILLKILNNQMSK